MNQLKNVIPSEEKNSGRNLHIVTLVFFAFISINALAMIFNNKDVASFYMLLPFYVVILLMYVIGRFQKKKYQKLGPTPLTLNPSSCTLGNPVNGSILIQRENFNKVTQLSITCLKQSSDSGSTRTDEIWKTSIEPKIEFENTSTILNFEFLIPRDKKASTKSFFSGKKYHWTIAFEFVESMESIKRTWKIPVTK